MIYIGNDFKSSAYKMSRVKICFTLYSPACSGIIVSMEIIHSNKGGNKICYEGFICSK